jgi:hypothetical protein
LYRALRGRTIDRDREYPRSRGRRAQSGRRSDATRARMIRCVVLLSPVCCLLPAVCCLLSAICCLLSAVCCLLFAVCCLLCAQKIRASTCSEMCVD